MIPADDELSLYSVLIHEIGHALGLQHTSHKNSIMYPYYYFPDFIKHIDDIDLQTPEIDAIQLLYGDKKKKMTVIKPTTTTTTPKPIPPFQPLLADICQFKNVIDNFLVINKRIYFFYRRLVWSIPLQKNLRNIRDFTRPLSIMRWLDFLPKNFVKVSAIYQRPNNDIVLIANRQVYLLDHMVLRLKSRPSYHSLLRDGNVNAVINVNKGKTYVIYDSFFVNEINECDDLKGHYVGDISNVFPGIPRNVSTAFKGIDGCLYFKANDLFYIYNEFLESSVGTLNNPLSLFDIECNERDNIINDIHGLVKKLWYKQSTQVTTATTTTTTTSVDEIYDSLNI